MAAAAHKKTPAWTQALVAKDENEDKQIVPYDETKADQNEQGDPSSLTPAQAFVFKNMIPLL